MNKKSAITFILLFSLVFNTTGIFASAWEWAWLDFFKTIDKSNLKLKTKLVENEIIWSAKKINDFINLERVTEWIEYIDTTKDFTKTELDQILDEDNVANIITRIKLEDENSKLNINSDNIYSSYIKEWYRTKKEEISAKQESMNRVSIVGLYNDWNVENSGYDLMDDLDRIHSIIFAKETKYSWTSNTAYSDYINVINWEYTNNPTVFNPLIPYAIPNSSSASEADIAAEQQKNEEEIKESLDQFKPSSNVCDNWSSITALDDNLLKDISSQINFGASSDNSKWWKWNTSSTWGTNKPVAVILPTGINWTSDFNSFNPWDEWSCGSFFCTEITYKMYNDWLVSGIDDSIEWILTKHSKIIKNIADQSLLQADITKNFFWLTVLRSLNLPNMLHLWIIVTYLPPPILNVKKDPNKDDRAEFEDKKLFIATFRKNWLDYKKQNLINPVDEYKEVWNSVNNTTDQAIIKLQNTKSTFQPEIDETWILVSKLWQSYNSSSNWDYNEFVWFTNSLLNNINQIAWIVKKLKEKK